MSLLQALLSRTGSDSLTYAYAMKWLLSVELELKGWKQIIEFREFLAFFGFIQPIDLFVLIQNFLEINSLVDAFSKAHIMQIWSF